MKHFVALLAFAAGLCCSISRATADAVIVTTQGVGTVTYDSASGKLSASNIPITAINYANGTSDPNAQFSFSALLSTSNATTVFGFLVVDSATDVQFRITDGAQNLLSGGASSAFISGDSAGLLLQAQNLTFNQGVNFSSDVIDTNKYQPESLAINIVNPYGNTGAVSVSGGNLTDFAGELAPSSFTADIVTPLPSAAKGGLLLLLAIGVATGFRKAAARF